MVIKGRHWFLEDTKRASNANLRREKADFLELQVPRVLPLICLPTESVEDVAWKGIEMKRKKPGLVKSEEEWIQMKDHILKLIETTAGEMGCLLELALGDDVLKDKMGGLYAQVAHAGFRMRDRIHDVDRLIKSTNLQFTSNLEDLQDYTSIIHLKSFEGSSIQELYCCFCVLWHAIAHKLAMSHGKNNLFII